MRMSKKTMWILCILGMALSLVGVVAYVIALISFTASSMANIEATSTPPASPVPDISGLFIMDP